MPEAPFEKNTIENDIERLSQELEQKRQQLQEVKEVHEDKEVLYQVVGERIQAAPTPQPSDDTDVQSDQKSINPTSELPDYLHDAATDIKMEIQQLIHIAFKDGIDKAAREAKKQGGFVVDAFHDALVDKLYNELKKRKLIK